MVRYLMVLLQLMGCIQAASVGEGILRKIGIRSYSYHTTMTKTEEKPKVVATVWGQNWFNSLPH